jgi:arginine/serine-rich splicing factor 17
MKAERRKRREEKRNQARIIKAKMKEKNEFSIRIAMEERKLLVATRKLESIRLLDALLDRVKVSLEVVLKTWD